MEAHGIRPQAVIDLMLGRLARAESCATATDGRRLGLVIEGGALRAVNSAGGAVVLAELGLSAVFDHVYATSAAVMNAGYFISNQPRLGISVYFENCTTPAFFNPWRFWKVVDVDYIFDRVAVHEKPLDVAAVRASPTTLHVAVMDPRTAKAFMVNTRTTATPLLRVLKASAAIPVFYNRTVEVDGTPCIDAGIRIPFGLQEALDAGCTDVLVLLTRPRDYASGEANWLDRRLFDLVCARGNGRLNDAYASKHEVSRALRDLAIGRRSPDGPVNIATVCPDETDNISRVTTDREALIAAATRYGRKMLRVCGREDDAFAL